MTQEEAKRGKAVSSECKFEPFKRNNYFVGKLMTERDFSDEQQYHKEKVRHHHQRLHGWGVVCGLKVKQHEDPERRDRFVCIEPGTAIDCCGHEILVPTEECIDITQFDTIKALIESNDKGPHTLQICILYRECPTEEIPILSDDCASDEAERAPNRILECYELDVVVDPVQKSGSGGQMHWAEQVCADLLWCHLDGCPSCDGAKRVVLATIGNYHTGDRLEDQPDPPVDAAQDERDRIARIDNRADRRLLPSTEILAESLMCTLEQGVEALRRSSDCQAQVEALKEEVAALRGEVSRLRRAVGP